MFCSHFGFSNGVQRPPQNRMLHRLIRIAFVNTLVGWSVAIFGLFLLLNFKWSFKLETFPQNFRFARSFLRFYTYRKNSVNKLLIASVDPFYTHIKGIQRDKSSRILKCYAQKTSNFFKLNFQLVNYYNWNIESWMEILNFKFNSSTEFEPMYRNALIFFDITTQLRFKSHWYICCICVEIQRYILLFEAKQYVLSRHMTYNITLVHSLHTYNVIIINY